MDQEEMNYLKEKGKDIAVEFLNVLNMKGLANATLDQLNEEKKIKERKKITELQKKLEKLANARKNNCKKNGSVDTNTKEVDEKKIDIELSDANILEDEYSIQHVEEIVENDCTLISPTTLSIQMTLNQSEIFSELKSEDISTRSLEHIKNMKQIKQFIVDENGHFSHTHTDIQGNKSELHIQNALHSHDTYEDFGNIEYSNMVLISQEEFDKNGNNNKIFRENEHLLCKGSLQKNHQTLLEHNEKVYIVSKDKVGNSEILESRKERKNNSASAKRKKQFIAKQMNDKKHLTVNNEMSINYKNLQVDNNNHNLSPLLISNDNSVRIHSDICDNEEYNSIPNCNDQNSILGSRLDHMYYNFKILPSSHENIPITESDNIDLAVNQVTLNNNQNCVVLDAGKSKYINSKNIVNVYVSESSDIGSENYICLPDKEFTISESYESAAFLNEKSHEENELCYHLLNLGSDNVLKLFHERTPSKLQININDVENISVPYVLLDHVETGKDFEKIIINDTFNQIECSNEDVNLESIAEIEETCDSEVTLHIVNDC